MVSPPRPDRSLFFTPRAWGLNITLAIVLPGFAALCWWQVNRALSGNSLSWAYVFEWPLFGLYAIYMWWKLVHEPQETVVPMAAGPGRSGGTDGGTAGGEGGDGAATGETDEADEELAAYNRYLADLHTAGRPKRW